MAGGRSDRPSPRMNALASSMNEGLRNAMPA
jgi:hypothetical protein